MSVTHRIPLLARVLTREIGARPGPVTITDAIGILTPTYADPARALDAIRFAILHGDLIEDRDRDGTTTITAADAIERGAAA